MRPAAFRWLVRWAVASLCAALAHAADASRAAPSRPGATPAPAALTVKKFSGVDYVRVSDLAARLGLKLVASDRGKKVLLSGGGTRAEFEADTREVTLNGLRVFLGDPLQAASGELYLSRVDFDRAVTPVLRPGEGVYPLGAPRLVVLDPGHGGKDNGTSVNEKTFALDVARRAKKALEAAGFRVVLTRDTDTYLELAQRAALANACGADLFVSIHFNALPRDTKTSGVEVFTFAPRGQHAAEWWSLLKKGDPDLETTEMPVNRYDHWSAVLAQAVQRRFVGDLKAFDRGRKLAHWGVLRPLICPGVLVECGFLTSEVEARKIATADYRQKLAEALAAGIGDYAIAAEGPRPKTSTLATSSPSPALAGR